MHCLRAPGGVNVSKAVSHSLTLSESANSLSSKDMMYCSDVSLELSVKPEVKDRIHENKSLLEASSPFELHLTCDNN